MNLQKTFDRVQRVELWYYKSGVEEKFVRAVQELCEDSDTVVRWAVGVTNGFKEGV